MHDKADHCAAKSGHDARKDGPDLAGADHRHGATHEIETHEAVELTIAVAITIVGPGNLAIEREEQANGKFGHGVRRLLQSVTRTTLTLAVPSVRHHLDMRVGMDVFSSNVRVVPPRSTSLSRRWL